MFYCLRHHTLFTEIQKYNSSNISAIDNLRPEDNTNINSRSLRNKHVPKLVLFVITTNVDLGTTSSMNSPNNCQISVEYITYTAAVPSPSLPGHVVYTTQLQPEVSPGRTVWWQHLHTPLPTVTSLRLEQFTSTRSSRSPSCWRCRARLPASASPCARPGPPATPSWRSAATARTLQQAGRVNTWQSHYCNRPC